MCVRVCVCVNRNKIYKRNQITSERVVLTLLEGILWTNCAATRNLRLDDMGMGADGMVAVMGHNAVVDWLVNAAFDSRMRECFHVSGSREVI